MLIRNTVYYRTKQQIALDAPSIKMILVAGKQTLNHNGTMMNNDTPNKYPFDEAESPETPSSEQPASPDPEPIPIEQPESI